MPLIETERLILRQWKTSDYTEFAALTASAEVMKYFPKTLTTEESNSLVERAKQPIETNGWGFWAAELKQTKQFIGFIGINDPGDGFPFSPCVEIGWRLAQQFWGLGLASEGARASLAYAFDELGLDEVVSMTPVSNLNSEKVMQRIGMVNTEQNFLHPSLNIKHVLAEHVLYKITSDQWQAQSA